jgi:hypothetical protein
MEWCQNSVVGRLDGRREHSGPSGSIPSMPAPLTVLIGRAAELQAVSEMLRRARLVTLPVDACSMSAPNALWMSCACLMRWHGYQNADSMSQRRMRSAEGPAIASGLVRVLRASVRCGDGRV